MSRTRFDAFLSSSAVILQRYILPCLFAGLLFYDWSPKETTMINGVNQSSFLNIMKNYSSKYMISGNQAQGNGIIKERNTAVYRLLDKDGFEFHGWVVTMYGKSTTKSGTTLAFRCGFDPEVKLIAAGSSPLPGRFDAIPEHTTLLLDGKFLPGDGGNYEQSFTEQGSAKYPKYRIEIRNVKSLQAEPANDQPVEGAAPLPLAPIPAGGHHAPRPPAPRSPA